MTTTCSLHLRRRFKGTQRRTAAAVVEFAVVAPLLALLVVGMIEFSRALSVKQLLNEAARKGCRTGILPGKGTRDITKDVSGFLAASKITTVTPIIGVDGEPGDPLAARQPSKVSVQISLPASQALWVSGWLLPGSTVLSEKVVMMKQGT